MIRPTISMGMFWAAQTMIEPRTLRILVRQDIHVKYENWEYLPDDGTNLNGSLSTKHV